MGSMYAALRKEQEYETNRISDLDETDAYYFVVKENDKILAEGDLSLIKYKLPTEYIFKKYKSIKRDKSIMLAEIFF